MTDRTTNPAGEESPRSNGIMAWVATAILCLAILSILFWQQPMARSMAENAGQPSPNYETPASLNQAAINSMPAFFEGQENTQLGRAPLTHTEVERDARDEVVEYTVVEGDTVWGIAERFFADFVEKPSDVFRYLYAIYNNNYDVLQDAADNLKPGQVLQIPPVPGVIYKWRNSDTFESVAAKFSANPADPTVPEGFHVTAKDILMFIGNNIDMSNPKVETGSLVMVPGGGQELLSVSYTAAVLASPDGTKRSGFSGPGACTFNQTMFGDGFIIWPSATHLISGNRFMPGHFGIDIGSGEGTPLYAVDDGIVAYAGWQNGGYGNLVVIDHGNGYESLYEHMERIHVTCGEAVFQGSQIGTSGNTGNSTGPHLHFEIRYGGTPVNPFDMLP